jgi:hypothetical protein
VFWRTELADRTHRNRDAFGQLARDPGEFHGERRTRPPACRKRGGIARSARGHRRREGGMRTSLTRGDTGAGACGYCWPSPCASRSRESGDVKI